MRHGHGHRRPRTWSSSNSATSSTGGLIRPPRWAWRTGSSVTQEAVTSSCSATTRASGSPTSTSATPGRCPGRPWRRSECWWTDGRAHLAVALDTQELGPLLVTHAGLSPHAWRDLGAPGTAEHAAGLIERWVGHDAGRAFTPAPPRVATRSAPGVTWGEPADVYTDWLAEADPPPFGQVHGHASAWSWKHRRWRKRTPAAVRAAAVAVDADRCHVQVRIGGRAFVGIDPGHLEEPRRPWAPLLLTIAPAPSGPATDGPERGHRGPPDR